MNRVSIFLFTLVMLSLFFILAYYASLIPYFSIDLLITQFVQQYHAVWFDLLMRLLTFIGNSLPSLSLVGVTFLLLLIRGFRWESLMLMISVTVATACSVILKVVVNRPRPSMEIVNVLYPMYSGSFPSGHVLFYIAFFGFLGFLVYSVMKRSIVRSVLLVFFGLMIMIIPLSRIYLGHHWASDTAGSYLLGSVLLLCCIHVYKRGKFQ